jgi:hypothetical protein
MSEGIGSCVGRILQGFFADLAVSLQFIQRFAHHISQNFHAVIIIGEIRLRVIPRYFQMSRILLYLGKESPPALKVTNPDWMSLAERGQ